MAFCGKCGTKVDDGVKFCPACGASVAAGTPTGDTQQQAEAQNDFSAKIAGLNNTADTTGAYDTKDVTDNKVMAILAYFGPLVLVPIFAAPKSGFARYHANQGLVLLIAAIAYGILQTILANIFWAISWRLGSLMSTIFSLVWLVFTVLAVIGIINAANGKAKELPVIGKIKILK